MADQSLADLLDLGKSVARMYDPDLAVNRGDVAEMDLAAGAVLAYGLRGWFARRALAVGFLRGSKGDDLTAKAKDEYGIDRPLATKAFGVVTLTRIVGTLSGTILAGGVVATVRDSTGVDRRLTTDADLSFAMGELSKSVDVTAQSAGKDWNLAAGAISVIVTGLFDTFSVTNADRISGGTEDMEDEPLRQLCIDTFTTKTKGTRAAIIRGAKAVVGVTNARVISVGVGLSSLYISDDSGSSNPTMIANVAAELLANWQSEGSVINVLGGTPSVAVSVTITDLLLRAGPTAKGLEGQIRDAVAARVNEVQIGTGGASAEPVAEILKREYIKAAVSNVDKAILGMTVLINGVDADFTPDLGQLIRIDPSDVTVI